MMAWSSMPEGGALVPGLVTLLGWRVPLSLFVQGLTELSERPA